MRVLLLKGAIAKRNNKHCVVNNYITQKCYNKLLQNGPHTMNNGNVFCTW